MAREQRVLRYAAMVFAAGFVFHNIDHLRRGIGVLTPEVFWGGVVLGVASLIAIALALAGHRLAPSIAVVVGLGGALAVAASHLLPHWSSFSDAFPGGHADAISWAAVISEIVGALGLGAAGVLALRRPAIRHLSPAPART